MVVRHLCPVRVLICSTSLDFLRLQCGWRSKDAAAELRFWELWHPQVDEWVRAKKTNGARDKYEQAFRPSWFD